MPRNRAPGNLVARHASDPERRDVAAHTDYDVMLRHDLGGRRTNSYRAIDDGGPDSAAALLMRPLSLFLMSCVALAIVLAVWAWQSGFIGQFLPDRGAVTPVERMRWTTGGRERTLRPEEPLRVVDHDAPAVASKAEDEPEPAAVEGEVAAD